MQILKVNHSLLTPVIPHCDLEFENMFHIQPIDESMGSYFIPRFINLLNIVDANFGMSRIGSV